MTSSRAYRPSMDARESLDLLGEGAGGQLEPGLVSILQSLWACGELREPTDLEMRAYVNERKP
jgi:hypothetical protein